MTRDAPDSSTPSETNAEPDSLDSPPSSAKVRKEIPLVAVPNEDEIMAQEMADLFDEDRVTHQHGHSEPEKD